MFFFYLLTKCSAKKKVMFAKYHYLTISPYLVLFSAKKGPTFVEKGFLDNVI